MCLSLRRQMVRRCVYSRGPRIPRELADRARAVFPTSGIPGLEKGKPAAASEVLGCVSDLVKSMHEQGFPDARLLEQHYYIDRKQKTLNAVLYVDPGEAAMLGNVSATSKSDVSPSYIARLAPWEPGQEFWDSRRVDEYIVKLRKTGLFKSVTPVVVPERQGEVFLLGIDAAGMQAHLVDGWLMLAK